jgi:hypothetical protein
MSIRDPSKHHHPSSKPPESHRSSPTGHVRFKCCSLEKLPRCRVVPSFYFQGSACQCLPVPSPLAKDHKIIPELEFLLPIQSVMALSQLSPCLITTLFLCFCARTTAIPDSNISRISKTFQFRSLYSGIRQFYPQAFEGRLGIWEVIQIVAMCSVLPGCWFLLRRRRSDGKSLSTSSGEISDVHNAGQYPADPNGKFLCRCKRYALTGTTRCRSHRSWPSEEAFRI